MKKIVKVKIDRDEAMDVLVQGAVDLDVRPESESCCEGSEEIVIHFADGKEISIYYLRGTIVVEVD